MSKSEKGEIYEYPKAMLRNGVDPVDILILNELGNGKSKSTLADELSKYGVTLTRTEVEKRIGRMKENGVLLLEDTVVVDPTKLFDHVFLNWLKLPLRPLLRRDELTWKRAAERILEINGRMGRHMMMLFTPEGEGEYDLVALVCTNDLAGYYAFLEQLARDELLEKSKTQRVHFPAMFHFDPLILPSYEQSKNAYDYCRKKLEGMKT